MAITAQIDRILAELMNETEVLVGEHISLHYGDGLQTAVNALQKAGISTAAGFNVLDTEAVEAITEETFALFGESMNGVRRSTKRLFGQARRRRIVDILATGRIKAETRRQISDRIKAELSNGAVVMRDKGGKTWTMDRYAEMLARTKYMEATNTGLTNRMVQEGADLVQVSEYGSTHDLCAKWEGKVVSITGDTPGYPTVEDTKEGGKGIGHPNCRHRYLPYRKGLASLTK